MYTRTYIHAAAYPVPPPLLSTGFAVGRVNIKRSYIHAAAYVVRILEVTELLLPQPRVLPHLPGREEGRETDGRRQGEEGSDDGGSERGGEGSS